MRSPSLSGVLGGELKIEKKMKVLDNIEAIDDMYIQFESQNQILSSTKVNWDATLTHHKVIYKGILPSEKFFIS